MPRRQFIFICLHHHHTFAVRWQYVRVRRVKGVVHAHYQISDWCDNTTTKCIKNYIVLSTNSHQTSRVSQGHHYLQTCKVLPPLRKHYRRLPPEPRSRARIDITTTGMRGNLDEYCPYLARSFSRDSLRTPRGHYDHRNWPGTSRRHRFLPTGLQTGRT